MPFWRDQVIQPALDWDVDHAVHEQEAILARDPRNASAHFALGTLAHFRGQVDAAVTYFLRAIELDPAYAAPHVSLGRIETVRGRYEEAWKHAREAERLGDRSLVEQLDRYPQAAPGAGKPAGADPSTSPARVAPDPTSS